MLTRYKWAHFQNENIFHQVVLSFIDYNFYYIQEIVILTSGKQFEDDWNVTLQKHFIYTLYWIINADSEYNDPQNNILKIYLKVFISFFKEKDFNNLLDYNTDIYQYKINKRMHSAKMSERKRKTEVSCVPFGIFCLHSDWVKLYFALKHFLSLHPQISSECFVLIFLLSHFNNSIVNRNKT